MANFDSITLDASERRRGLILYLKSDECCWREEDHPEFKDGVEVWVERIRREGEVRIPES